MRWARKIGQPGRHEATKGARGVCEVCGGEVLAKCGALVTDHWAHRSADCDPWSEPETAWHRNWKGLFPEEWQEVVIGKHRADIKTPKVVIELQHSSISTEEIREREQFYGDMVWVFDQRRSIERIDGRPPQTNRFFPEFDAYERFEWLRHRRSLAVCEKPVFIHLGRGRLYHVFNFGMDGRVKPLPIGHRMPVSKDAFLATVGAGPGTPIPLFRFGWPAERRAEVARIMEAEFLARRPMRHFPLWETPAVSPREFRT